MDCRHRQWWWGGERHLTMVVLLTTGARRALCVGVSSIRVHMPVCVHVRVCACSCYLALWPLTVDVEFQIVH